MGRTRPRRAQETDEEARPAHPAVQQGTRRSPSPRRGGWRTDRDLCESVSVELAQHSPILRVFPSLLNARTQWMAGLRPPPATCTPNWRRSHAGRTKSSAAYRVSGLAASAAVLGDLEAAQGALKELRTLPDEPPGYFSVGEEHLGEAWLLAAGGHQSKARSVLCRAADAARSTGHITSEGLLLTEIARLGGAKEDAGRLAEIAEVCDGELAGVRARFASSLAAGEPGRLMDAAEEFENLGAHLAAAEAAAAAADLWRRRGEGRQATAASVRSDSLAAAHCEGAETPLLDTVRTTTPLTSREREISMLAAAGEHEQGDSRRPDPVGPHRRQPPPEGVRQARHRHPPRTRGPPAAVETTGRGRLIGRGSGRQRRTNPGALAVRGRLDEGVCAFGRRHPCLDDIAEEVVARPPRHDAHRRTHGAGTCGCQGRPGDDRQARSLQPARAGSAAHDG